MHESPRESRARSTELQVCEAQSARKLGYVYVWKKPIPLAMTAASICVKVQMMCEFVQAALSAENKKPHAGTRTAHGPRPVSTNSEDTLSALCPT